MFLTGIRTGLPFDDGETPFAEPAPRAPLHMRARISHTRYARAKLREIAHAQ